MNKPERAKSHKKPLGDFGEGLAEKAVLARGWPIIARNWRFSRLGEIDLIAYDAAEDCLHLIEVKTRHTGSMAQTGHAIEAMTPSKQAKLHQLAEVFLAQLSGSTLGDGHNISAQPNVAMDVITVEGRPGETWQIEWLENAF